MALGAAAVVGASLVAVLFLTGLAAKERDNRFCVSCHLHDEKFQRLTASTSTDLAGLHHVKDPAVGCIDCHGGADLRMRVTVWNVAGFDTVKFLTGAYHEPTAMRLPLRNAECRQCHTPIVKMATARPAGTAATAPAAVGTDESYEAEAAMEGRGGTSYHAIREHDTVSITCVRCHSAHTTDSEAGRRFISQARVGVICRECHKSM